jgi:hypothetical protein
VKKLILAHLIYVCIPFFVYGHGGAQNQEEYAESSETTSKLSNFLMGEEAALSTGKRETRRYFELGLLDLNLGLTGMDMEGLFKGSLFDFGGIDTRKMNSFTADVALFGRPLYLKFSLKNAFALDFFTAVESKISVSVPEKTIDALAGLVDKVNNPPAGLDPSGSSFKDALDLYEAMLREYTDSLTGMDAKLSAGAGVFMEIGVGGSKTILEDRLWIRAAPSMFFTLLYMQKSEISLKGYSDPNNNRYGLAGDGRIKMYSAWDLDNDINPFASPGVDITLEARYALWSVLDAGLSISHIPIVPSTLTHSKSLNADKITMTVDADPEKIINDPANVIDFNVPDLGEMYEESGNENKQVMRPVRFDFYTLYKPFKSPVFIVKPNIGATVNGIVEDNMFNWGLELQFNAPLIFSAFIGTGLTEGIWANRAGIALDFRAFEVDIGAAVTAPTFEESFSFKKGLAVAVGFKFGF